MEDIETARLHNEVSRRGLNGGDSPGLRVRGRASSFLRAFAVPMRFAVGAGSNKRTVGRFSFCGLSPDPYSLPVSLFRGGGGGGERASVTLRLCTVPQVLPSRKEPWRSRELFLSRCLANRRGVAAFRSTNGGIIILSISRARRRYAGDSSDSERCACVGLAWETPP